MMTPEPTPWTYLAFHHDGDARELSTTVVSARPFTDLEEANQQLFKLNPEKEHYVVCTKETIFHPQGGGQPSDEGVITSQDGSVKLTVTAVRMDAVNAGQALHVGHFEDPSSSFPSGSTVKQQIDVEKRLLYSRLHTAGHVLGSAVRHLCAASIPDFDELKASHFPSSASCEFKGSIGGEWKDKIQQRVDEYVEKDMPVEIEWWTEEDFVREDMASMIPDKSFLGPGESKFRVVRIRGAEVYPCGGTHVKGTKACGKTTVRKIARSKGISRVGYNVE